MLWTEKSVKLLNIGVLEKSCLTLDAADSAQDADLTEDFFF